MNHETWARLSLGGVLLFRGLASRLDGAKLNQRVKPPVDLIKESVNRLHPPVLHLLPVNGVLGINLLLPLSEL
jgi:hypothetical protein